MKAVTQAEVQSESQAKLLIVGNNLARNILSIEEVGDYIPGSVMVQDLCILTNTYMNQAGCNYLRHSKEELQALGSEYFSRFFPAEEMIILKAELNEFINQGDFNKVYSFFQRVRPNSQTDYEWYFTTSRLYSPQHPADPPKIMHVAIQAQMLTYAGKKLSNLVDDDTFVRKNYHRFNMLSVREKQIIRLIVEGKSSNDIAEQLFLSIHTVNNHRKNILHKLEIHCLTELIKFAYSFGII